MTLDDVEKLRLLDSDERRDVIEAESISVEIMSYMKPLTEDEKRQFKDDLTQICIRRQQYEKELDDLKADYKLKIDPLKKLLGSTIDALKHEAMNVDDDVYQIPDYKNNIMMYLDASGYLINQRVLSDQEIIKTSKKKSAA